MSADRFQMYLDGRWVDADGGKTFEVRNPADQTVAGIVPDGGVSETRRAIEAAHRVFPGWSRTPARDRGAILRRIMDLMLQRREEIARLVVLENGKPYEEAKGEVGFSTGYFGWFAEEARRSYGEAVPSPFPHKRLWVQQQPVGVVGAVTPWNFPANMITRKIAPAMAAGCTVVLKPASATPMTALAIARCAHDAGLPPGVLNIVTASRSRAIGDELLSNPLVRKIGFTGSTDVGKGLMEQAAKQVKRISFELGGNAPFIVFDDADFEKALEGAVAMKFLRVGGQSCICANRIFVQETIAARFIPAFVERARALKVGPGFEPGMQVGPLINEEARKSMQRFVEDAVSRGAKVLTGGRAVTTPPLDKGFFFEPTVLVDVKDSMSVCVEEIFGPIAPLLTFQTEEEVIRRANDTTYGLAAYFYSRDYARIVRVSEGLEAGLVGVNDAQGYTHEIPFGGFKESGLGREGGREGIQEYMEVKSVVVNLE
ncbi:MAG TPA: NAD-dependent succinate-semialdehyde dehydrogenase [Candidatus Methylomirabilis sp.]